MSSFPPPYPYFNGITYDRAFFNQTTSSGLTVAQANAKFLKKTTPDIATALETFQSGIQTDLIKSNGGFGGTIYTDPGPTQTYATLVCQNNSTCSFGGSAGTCNLGGLSSGVNIGYNMSNGTQIAIATSSVQDTNIAIATKGIYPSGVNKILIGASTNTTTLASGTINIYSPFTPSYPYTFTTGTGTTPYSVATAISSNDKIGYAYYVPLQTVTNAPLNSGQYARQVLTVPNGVYMVSWTCVTLNSITIGISGFVVTGLNIALNSNVGTWGAGYNYYQSGYTELKGSITNGTAISGSVCVIIGAGSSHNTIGIATVYGSTGNTGVGDVSTSMSVVRVA